MKNLFGFGAAALLFIVVGALVLRGTGDGGPLNPVASVTNGHPRGWMAVHRLWQTSGIDVNVRRSHGEELSMLVEAGRRSLLVVPPAEGATWTKPEVEELTEMLAKSRLHIVVACDDAKRRNPRVDQILEVAGVRCGVAGGITKNALLANPLGKVPLMAFEGIDPEHPPRLDVHTPSAVFVRPESGLNPVVLAGRAESLSQGAALTMTEVGLGRIYVLGASSAWANDGLARGANAALALQLAEGRAVVIDEAHHHQRRAEVVGQLFDRAGPQVGLLALLLLLPLSLLGLAPRPADPPRGDEVDDLPAAEAASRALASLYLRAGLSDEEDAPASSASDSG